MTISFFHLNKHDKIAINVYIAALYYFLIHFWHIDDIFDISSHMKKEDNHIRQRYDRILIRIFEYSNV